MDKLEQKKYPIGQFQCPEKISDPELDQFFRTIKEFPSKLKHLVENRTDE